MTSIVDEGMVPYSGPAERIYYDTVEELALTLRMRGIYGALGFLNNRTRQGFTGTYRFNGEFLTCLCHWDTRPRLTSPHEREFLVAIAPLIAVHLSEHGPGADSAPRAKQ